jgi:hypothetical protein
MGSTSARHIHQPLGTIKLDNVIPLKILITLSLLTVFLTGCSFYADLYFINKTDKEAFVIIKLASGLEEIKKENYQLQLKYADQILEVNDETIDQLTGKVEYESINSKTIKIKLPPSSTSIIGGGYNGLPRQFEKYIIEKDDSITTLTTEQLGQLTKKTGGTFPPFHFTYVID